MVVAVQSLPGAGWAAWDGDVLLLEALPVEEQLCEGWLAALVCRVLPFSCVNSGLLTSHKAKSELAVAFEHHSLYGVDEGLSFGDFPNPDMSRTCN